MSAKATSSNVDNQKNAENSDDVPDNSLPSISGKDMNAENAKTAANSSSVLSAKRIHTPESFHCLLLQDTTRNATPPPHFQLFFGHYELKILTQAELLFQLVYLVALETGFAEQVTYQKCVSQLRFSYSVVTFFDAQNVLLLVQYKPAYSCDANSTQFRMKLESIVSETDVGTENLNFVLSGIVTGDLMIVTLTPIRDESLADVCSARSICLTMPRYVIGIAWRDNAKPLQQFLAKMDELTYNLRENLFVPVQNEYLALKGAELYPALLGMPGELYDCIFQWLSPNQLRILANVNKQLHQLVVNSKHYKKEQTLRSGLSFLSPSQSQSSNRSFWATYY